MLELDPSTKAVIDSAVVVTGGGRSGTTILGKLLHTFQGVEYAFEPPMLVALFSLINQLPEAEWKFLYEAYLAEEFLANAMAGRAINTNLADDSSIYAVKAVKDVENRLARSWSKQDIMRQVAGKTLAYKLPNIVPFLRPLMSYCPSARIVVIQRNALDSIQSLLLKSWFKNDGAQAATAWPFRQVGIWRVPYWVRPGEESLWCELSELDRCAYYYLLMSDVPQQDQRVIHVRYSDLVHSPADVTKRLAQWVGVEEGCRTQEVVASIRPANKPIDADIIQRISLRFRDAVLERSALVE